jgi:hypothetical protein
MPDYAVFTVCNLAYMPKAAVLAESVLKHCGKKLKIFLFDKPSRLGELEDSAEYYWVEDLGIANFRQMAFKYDIIELSTSLKPFISLELLKEYGRLIFLDPDTCLYGPVDPILVELEAGSVVLTPHYTTPQTDDLSESDLGMLRFGSFNLGFFAVKATDQGKAFLSWWSARCMNLCYMESQFGLSVDQKWVSIAPCFFADLRVSFHLGCNVAAWNSYERFIEDDKNGGYLVNRKYPLVFFHFSHFDPDDPGYMKKRSLREKGVERPDLTALGTAYAEALERHQARLEPAPYAYDYMSGGEYVSPALRRAYACVLSELPPGHDPFDSDGVVGDFARKNHLLRRREGAYKAQGVSDISGYAGGFRLAYFFLRFMLRVAGPNRFQNFSRLMVYLSSYRQNRGLWKL